MVNMELLYQALFKEGVVAQTDGSGPSSISYFKVCHSCRELLHSKHALPSVVHIQLWIEAGS